MSEKNLKEKSVGVRLRLSALLFDWLFICVYLFGLFVVMITFYLVVIGEIPEFSHLQSQLVAMITTIIPISIIFSVMEGTGNYASWGKKKNQLVVTYRFHPAKGSLIRNVLKFLPWQLGHMSTIYGIYNGYDSLFPMICLVLSLSLAVSYILMGIFRKDGRHLADLMAGSQVIKR
ncbi:MAG: RDD family protein [Alkalibacterium sp.]|nr:RDD family protein [Alkalibacterium sp.]